MEPSFYEDDNAHTHVHTYRQNRILLDISKTKSRKIRTKN